MTRLSAIELSMERAMKKSIRCRRMGKSGDGIGQGVALGGEHAAGE
jgi:hypothetical protein